MASPSILLVEDTPEIQQMYQFGLIKEGFSVEAVSSAGEALARVEAVAYNAIVLDLMLGGMSGLDFLKESQIKLKHPETKIIIFTNMDSQDVRERVTNQGIDGYLMKANTDPKQLAEYLRGLLAAPAAGAAADPAAPTQG
jgi:CheY-like chemotaxis protein